MIGYMCYKLYDIVTRYLATGIALIFPTTPWDIIKVRMRRFNVNILQVSAQLKDIERTLQIVKDELEVLHLQRGGCHLFDDKPEMEDASTQTYTEEPDGTLPQWIGPLPEALTGQFQPPVDPEEWS